MLAQFTSGFVLPTTATAVYATAIAQNYECKKLEHKTTNENPMVMMMLMMMLMLMVMVTVMAVLMIVMIMLIVMIMMMIMMMAYADYDAYDDDSDD